MYARIIDPSDELGDFHTLTFYGHKLSSRWSSIEPNSGVLGKLQGNRFVELRESDDEAGEPATDPRKAVMARLVELGVEFDGRAKLATLQALLDGAEAARDAAEGEEGDDADGDRDGVAEDDTGEDDA